MRVPPEPNPSGGDPRDPFRRKTLAMGTVALAGSSLASGRRASADPLQTLKIGDGDLQAAADRSAVTDVILRERLARELHDPDEEAACFQPGATVAVSWFKGSAAAFIQSGGQTPSTKTVNFDSMSPPVITLNQDRATADAACAVHTFTQLEGVEVSSISYTRLLWRVQKARGRWLIASLECIYIRDELGPRDPGQLLKLDPNRLNRYRESYRYLSYILTASGRPCYDDLPGVDRPETVAAVRASARAWMAM